MKFKKKITSLVVLSAFSATQCGFLEAVAAGKSNTSGSLLGSLFKKIYSTDASKSKNKNKKRSLKNNKKNIKAKNKESFKQIVKSAAAENKKSKEKVVSPKVKNENSVKKTKNNVTSEESNSKLRKTPEKFEISLEKTELADEVGKDISKAESLSIPEKSKENIKEVNESIAKKGETKTVDPFDDLFNYGSNSKKSKNSSSLGSSFLKNLDLDDAITAASLAFLGAYVADKNFNSGKMSNYIRRQFFGKQEKTGSITGGTSGTGGTGGTSGTSLSKTQGSIADKGVNTKDESKPGDAKPLDYVFKSGYLPHSIIDLLKNNKDLIDNGDAKKIFELVEDRTYNRSYGELVFDWIAWISNPSNRMALYLKAPRLVIKLLTYIDSMLKEQTSFNGFFTGLLAYFLIPLVFTYFFLYGKFEPIVALQRIFDRSGSWREDLALVVRDIIRLDLGPIYWSILSGFGNVGKRLYYEKVPFNTVSEGSGGVIKGTWENLVPVGYYFSRFVNFIRWLFGKSSDALDLISYVGHDGKKSPWVLYNGLLSKGSYKAFKLNSELNFFDKADGKVNIDKVFGYAKKQIILKLEPSKGETVDPSTKKVTKKEVADESFLEFLKLPWWEFNDWIGIMPKKLSYIHDKVLGKLIEFSKKEDDKEAELVKNYLENTKMYGKTLEQLREDGYFAYKNKLLDIAKEKNKILGLDLKLEEKDDLLKKLSGEGLAKLFVLLYEDLNGTSPDIKDNEAIYQNLLYDVFVFASNCDDSDDFFNDEKVKKIIDSVYDDVKKKGKIKNSFELFVTLKKDINLKKLIALSNWIFEGKVAPASEKEKICQKLLNAYFEYFIKDNKIFKEIMDKKTDDRTHVEGKYGKLTITDIAYVPDVWSLVLFGKKGDNNDKKEDNDDNKGMKMSPKVNNDVNLTKNKVGIKKDKNEENVIEERVGAPKGDILIKEDAYKIVLKLWKKKEDLIKEIKKVDSNFDVKKIGNDESVLTLVQKLKIEKLLPDLELSPEGIALLYSNICDEEEGFKNEEDKNRYSRISSVLFEFLDQKGKKEVDEIRNNVKKFAEKVLDLFLEKFVLDKNYSIERILDGLESLFSQEMFTGEDEAYAANFIISKLADCSGGLRITEILKNDEFRKRFIKILGKYYECYAGSFDLSDISSADMLALIICSPYMNGKDGNLVEKDVNVKCAIINNFKKAVNGKIGLGHFVKKAADNDVHNEEIKEEDKEEIKKEDKEEIKKENKEENKEEIKEEIKKEIDYKKIDSDFVRLLKLVAPGENDRIKEINFRRLFTKEKFWIKTDVVNLEGNNIINDNIVNDNIIKNSK